MVNVRDGLYPDIGKKTPRLQALPTKNLPIKSHNNIVVERKLPAVRVVTDDMEGKEIFVYKDLRELYTRVQKSNRITEK